MTLEISERAKRYSQLLQDALEFDKTTGAASVDKDVVVGIFAGELPEEITMKQVKEVQDASIDFAVGQSDALASKSLEWLKDSELNSTSLSTKVEGNRYDNVYTKHRSGTAMGKPWEKWGSISSDLVQGTGRRGGIKNVIKYHNDLAEKTFSK